MASNASILNTTIQQITECSEFKILTEDSGPLFTKHRTGPKISADLKVVLEIWDTETNEYHPRRQTACELILVGRNHSMKQSDSRGSLYVTVPAHLILDDDECTELAAGRQSIDDVRFAVGGRSNKSRLYLEIQDTSEQFDLVNRPLICYRHWTDQRRSTGTKNFMTDLALLEISPMIAERLFDSLSSLEASVTHPHTPKKIKQMMTEHREFHHLESSWISISIEKIFPQFEVHDLGEMYRREVRVMCKGMIGYMHKIIYRQIGSGRRYTHHITFIREDKG